MRANSPQQLITLQRFTLSSGEYSDYSIVAYLIAMRPFFVLEQGTLYRAFCEKSTVEPKYMRGPSAHGFAAFLCAHGLAEEIENPFTEIHCGGYEFKLEDEITER